jgi:hypothetical protein
MNIGLLESAIKQKGKDKGKDLEEKAEGMEKPAIPETKPNLFSLNLGPSDNLVLELNGKNFSDKNELTADDRERLINLLSGLRPWLEVTAPTQVTPPIHSTPEPQKPPVSIFPPASAPSLAPPKPGVPDKKAKPVKSIVFQINEILQAHLAGTPLESQGILLQESPTGGVLVYIGLEKFEDIDAVPNLEIKALIRQSVAEWEKQVDVNRPR